MKTVNVFKIERKFSLKSIRKTKIWQDWLKNEITKER
jgi:hypothetical protein